MELKLLDTTLTERKARPYFPLPRMHRKIALRITLLSDRLTACTTERESALEPPPHKITLYEFMLKLRNLMIPDH